ncbi:hypothetical protein L6452_29765 [Arctium lappa]|uniref:Uncharacterized protein n=1 Tax=Arctium lappa TaxID=4217 RepID=A0ACB8ZI94_ARCLA|nr:hypothetical protein L6452_29765 [Arctium lappa]
MVLEGGSNLNSLANSVLASVEVFLEDKPIAQTSEIYPFESTWRVIKLATFTYQVHEELSAFWPVLAEKLTGQVTPQVQGHKMRHQMA